MENSIQTRNLVSILEKPVYILLIHRKRLLKHSILFIRYMSLDFLWLFSNNYSVNCSFYNFYYVLSSHSTSKPFIYHRITSSYYWCLIFIFFFISLTCSLGILVRYTKGIPPSWIPFMNLPHFIIYLISLYPNNFRNVYRIF